MNLPTLHARVRNRTTDHTAANNRPAANGGVSCHGTGAAGCLSPGSIRPSQQGRKTANPRKR